MTKRGIRRALCVAAAVVAVAAAAGCGDDDDSSNGSSDTTEASDNGTGSVVQSAQQLCDSLESLSSTVQDIGSDPERPPSPTLRRPHGLRSEVSDVASSGSALAGALGPPLQSAFDQFESTVEGITARSDETLEAAGGLARSATDSSSSRGAALDSLNCERSSGSLSTGFHPHWAMRAAARSVSGWARGHSVQAVDALPGGPPGVAPTWISPHSPFAGDAGNGAWRDGGGHG